MDKIKDEYVKYAQSFFHMLTGEKFRNKSDYKNDVLLYWTVVVTKFVFIWILLPLFIVLPLITFFFSISSAIVFTTLYIFAIMIYVAVSVIKKLIK